MTTGPEHPTWEVPFEVGGWFCLWTGPWGWTPWDWARERAHNAKVRAELLRSDAVLKGVPAPPEVAALEEEAAAWSHPEDRRHGDPGGFAEFLERSYCRPGRAGASPLGQGDERERAIELLRRVHAVVLEEVDRTWPDMNRLPAALAARLRVGPEVAAHWQGRVARALTGCGTAAIAARSVTAAIGASLDGTAQEAPLVHMVDALDPRSLARLLA